MKHLFILILITSMGLVACSDNKEAKHEGVLTNAQEKALNDAKAVDDKILKADEERKKKLDEETQ
jgi:hypothetical protein